MRKLPPKKVVYENKIELRLISPVDGPAIYEAFIASLPELRHFMSWAHFERDLSIACSVYADFEASSLKGEAVHFASFDISTGQFLFCCSLVPGSRMNPLAFDIGYWVSSLHAGKGLGTIAAKTLISLAFHEYQANRLSVFCNPENSRSLKVIENCGFQFEGRLKNYLMQPTPEMIAQGYSSVTDAVSFCLVPQDLSTLPWFKDFYPKLSIVQYEHK